MAFGSKASLNGNYTINQKAAASSTNYKSFNSFFKDLESGMRTDTFTSNGSGVSGAVFVAVVKGSGPYYESISIGVINGVSAKNSITLKGNNEQIEFATSSSALPVISFNGADYLTLDGLTIIATGSSFGRCVELRNQSDYITIINCNLQMPYLSGTSDYNGYIMITNGTTNPRVYTEPGKYCKIINNKMSAQVNKGPYFGILISNPAYGTTNTDYEITGNDLKDVYTHFIYGYYTIGTKIHNNLLHNDSHSRQGYIYGIYLYNYQTRCDAEIVGNKMYYFNNNATGAYDGRFSIYIQMYGAANSRNLLIANNIIDLQSTYYTPGVYVYSYGASNTRVDFFYNTLYYGGKKTNTYSFDLYMCQMNYVDLDCRNNIFYCDWDISGTLYGLYYYSGSIIFENNDMYLNGITGSGSAYYGFDGITTYGTLRDWEKGVYGKNNLNIHPLLANPANQNWRPSSFGIVNKGTPVTVVNDIFKNSRSNTNPDLGAIEYYLDVEILDFSLNRKNVCGNYQEAISFTIKNKNSYPIYSIPMAFDINESNKWVETVDRQIESGDSLKITFSQKATFNFPGKNTIKVYLDGIDDSPKDNIVTDTLNVTPAPFGGYLSAAFGFPGYFQKGLSGGTMSNPDIVIPGMEIIYDIENPIGLLNPGYGIGWNMSGIFLTAGGWYLQNDVSYYTPSGSAKGFLKFKPSGDLSDSLIFIGVKVRNIFTGCDSVFGRYVYVPHVPEVNFTFEELCDGEVAEFKNTTTIKKGNVFYKWRFNDPNRMDDTSEVDEPFYTYTNYGEYDVELEARLKDYPDFKFVKTKKITITPVPMVDFKVLNACEGEAVVFNDKSVFKAGSGSEAIYNWRFGDGSANAYIQNPSHLYSQPGAYQVTLTVSSNGCGAALTKSVNQFAKPVAAFEKSGDCHQVAVSFINKTTIAMGNIGNRWVFGDGDISNLRNPEHTFQNPGSKTVTLTAVSEFGCTDSAAVTFFLKESPRADFEFSDPCSLTPVQFQMTGSIPDGNSPLFEWNFDDKDSSFIEQPKYLFNDLGTKTVTLKVIISNGCSDIIKREIFVKRQAKAAFEAKNECEGEEVTFTNKSQIEQGILQYEWRFGDANISNKTSPTHKYMESGFSRTYQVTLVARVPDGCSDSVSKPVTIFAKSDADFKDSVAGRYVRFTPVTKEPTYSYNWRFGEGSSSTDIEPLHVYSNIDQGIFEACLGLINDAGCLSEVCKMVTIDLVGVDEYSIGDFRLFPNPARDYLNIDWSYQSGKVALEIYDLFGRQVYRGVGSVRTIDVSVFEEGIYLLKVINENGIHILKLSVVR
jgi:PKD repeat protein